VRGDDLVGVHMSLFATKPMSHKLVDIATSRVKLGFQGKMGNKGAVLLRFLYEDTSFCFVCCHLESGSNRLDSRRRLEELHQVWANGFITERGTH